MDFSMEYVQHFTDWLKNHSEWSLLLTFLISFIESLAIIGSIVPGSVMMTMIGILAGTGVMRVDLTLITATLGAIAGDGGSYLLGYYFSDRLFNIWPFKKYPKWLAYGKAYFERYGGKSVFFGRFVGPLRSIIPMIAGMMQMKRLEFLIANSISAVGWSIVYVGPGILIGTASSDLSAESATRLFLIILSILLSIWLMSLGVRRGWKHLSLYLPDQLHHLWCKAKTIRILKPLMRPLTPPNEINHTRTCAFVLLFFIFFLLSILLMEWIFNETTLESIDMPVYFFLQSFRTHAFDVFFTIMALLISPYPMIVLILALIGFSIFLSQWRTLKYWLSLCMCCLLLGLSFNHYIETPNIDTALFTESSPLFPANHLVFATAILSFLMFKISTYAQSSFTKSLKLLSIGILSFAAIALLYLGDNWLTGVLAALSIGLCIAIFHWIFYRRYHEKKDFLYTLISAFVLYIATCIIVICIDLKSTMIEHSPSPQQFVLTHNAWWKQKQPLLPIYSSTRLGRPAALFNIQYLGSLQHFQHTLEKHGWKIQSFSFLNAVLSKTGMSSATQPTPLNQFYLNQKPQLVMTYRSIDQKTILILSLWRSNFHLLNHSSPLWLGSIQPCQSPSKSKKINRALYIPLGPLLTALEDFETHTSSLPNSMLPGYNQIMPLLMIQEKLK